MVLIAIIVLLILIVAVYLFFHVPLNLSVISDFMGSEYIYSKLKGYWGPFSIEFLFENGEAKIFLFFMRFILFTHQFKDMRKETELGLKDDRIKLKLKQGDRKFEYHIETFHLIIKFFVNIAPNLWNFIKFFINSAKVQSLKANIRYGTGDPALTGSFFGLFSAIRPLLHLHDGVILIFSPDFEDRVLEGDIQMALFLERPLLVLLQLLPIIFSTKSWIPILDIGRRVS